MIVFAEGSEMRRAKIVEEMNPRGHFVVGDLFDICLCGANRRDRVVDVEAAGLANLADDLNKERSTCFSC